MRKTAREALTEAKLGQKAEPTVQLDLKGLFTRMLSDVPEPTQWEFICDPEMWKLYMGRAGAAKTSTVVSSIIGRAILQPGFAGGIMRNDYNDMYDTVIKRAEEILSRLSPDLLLDRNKSPPMRWWLRCAVNNPDGSPAVSQITFSGISDLPKGFEANAIAVDEADECNEKDIAALKMRLRNPGGNYALMLTCNPPDITHWLYTAATGKDQYDKKVMEPWLKLYTPKDGENEKHLPENYYTDRSAGMPEDLRQRFIHGQWGQVFEGQPVYREFSSRLHICDDLRPQSYWPILRLRDFGYRRPCVIFAQLDENTGGLDCFREILGENEEVSAFESRVQAMSNQYYRGHTFIDFGDPAVDQHKDTGSTLELLKNQFGVDVNYIRSEIEEGIRTVRLGLERIVHGRPQFQFDRKGVPILIRALRGGYRINDNGTRPLKDGYYDHEADAFRYGVINIFGADGAQKPLPQTSKFYEKTSLHNNYYGANDTAEYDPRYDPDGQD